jgi:hypothetical protein
MNNETLVESYTAFDVFQRKADVDGFVHLHDDDVLFYEMSLYKLGNIWSYALKTGRDVDSLYERAIKEKQPLRWINKRSSVISDVAPDKRRVVKIYDGMCVIYMKEKYVIHRDSNNNFKFYVA